MTTTPTPGAGEFPPLPPFPELSYFLENSTYDMQRDAIRGYAREFALIALRAQAAEGEQSAAQAAGKEAAMCQKTPLSGLWHQGNGHLACGTLRIARWDCDTNPPEAFRDELLEWMCDVLNAAQRLAATPAPAHPLPVAGWQPISTAPKFVPVRLYAQGGGFHDEDFNPSGSVEGHWSDDTAWCGAFWNPEQDCWDRRDGIVPTHWQPLPNPPEDLAHAAPAGETKGGA